MSFIIVVNFLLGTSHVDAEQEEERGGANVVHSFVAHANSLITTL